ncbi:MAG TPA: zinc-binding dehydrogenase [Kofleriaceae bacterium]|nr:zinc-binding dehydrogenase [Kofleriaceae bacterium]
MREQAVPARMRAAVLTAPRELELREVDTPAPTGDQVLIRVEGCGVCGSNLPLWEGREWFSYPRAPGSPGHEGWGTVAELGPSASGVSVGDRVGFLSERAFAEYDVAPASSLVALPPALDGCDAPAEALGCVMNIWRRSGIDAGQTVAVVGVGFLGALMVQLAARAGARVIAISRRASALELARRMGAHETIELGADDGVIVRRVEELTGGIGCDRAIELVGAQRPLALAAMLCRIRGRLVIAGFHQDGPRQVDMFLWNWRGLDVINAHERAPAAYVAGMAAALDRVSSGLLDPEPLYTHRVPLARAGEAFALLRQRPDGFVKALVIP